MNILLVLIFFATTIGLVNYYYKLIETKKNKEKLTIALLEMTKTTFDGLKKMQEIANTKQNCINKEIMTESLNNKLEYEKEIEQINKEALEKIKEVK